MEEIKVKYEPKKVFIIENGNYAEYTYQKFCTKREQDTSFENKFFIPVQGMLLEVTSEQYREFYRDKERNRYLKKLDMEHGLLSLDGFDGEDESRAEFIPGAVEDIADIAVERMMKDRLRNCILLLSADEQKLICRHYYDEISEVELSHEYGITQQAISKRLKKIRMKLKDMLE